MPQSTPFAPSELVLLFGDRFAGEGGGLAREVLTLALLAMEHSGEIRIFRESRRALLGLTRREAVVAEATGSRAAWPAGSLEGELRETINGSRPELAEVVARWLGSGAESPERFVLERVRRGMVGRGLVQQGERRAPLLTDALPDATRALLAAQSPGPLLELARGEMADPIRRQVTRALTRRANRSHD